MHLLATITYTATYSQVSTAYETATVTQAQIQTTSLQPYTTFITSTITSIIYPEPSTYIISASPIVTTIYSTLIETSFLLQPTTIIESRIITLEPQNITRTETTSLAPYTNTFVSSYLTTLFGPTITSILPASTELTTIISREAPVTQTIYSVLPASTIISIVNVPPETQSIAGPTTTEYRLSLVTTTLPPSTLTTVQTIISTQAGTNFTFYSTYQTILPASTLVLTETLAASTISVFGPTVTGPTETRTSISVVLSTVITTLPASSITFTTISLSVQPASSFTETRVVISTAPGSTIYYTR